MILALPVPYFEARGFGAYSTQQIQQMITAQAQADGVPPSIALGVAAHESNFNPNAQNPNSSAAGLFQMLTGTWSSQGVTNPYDPTQNIDAGVGLLAQYYAKYGNWATALQAYADGPGTVAAGLPPSAMAQQFQNYVLGYSAPAGLDTSDSSLLASTGFDFSALGLPDLTQSTLIDGIPDWMTWSGIALAGGGLIMALTRG